MMPVLNDTILPRKIQYALETPLSNIQNPSIYSDKNSTLHYVQAALAKQ